MKRRSLWEVSVATPPAAEDPVQEVIETFFSLPASSYTHLDSGRVTISVYLPCRPAPGVLSRLARAMPDRVGGVGALKAGWRSRISLRQLPEQDWTESWKRHFRPLFVAGRLLVKPGWSRARAGRGQATVILDPGLSFGTGQHPTTLFCLEQLARRRRPGERQSFLDIGTGSGILAISAAKLGYQPVAAFDVDPEAVRIARGNARRNRLGHRVRVRRGDLKQAPGAAQYDVVCGNLISSLLMEERDRIVGYVKPCGVLVLAGVLAAEFGALQRAYAAAGLRLIASRRVGEWRSGAFARSGTFASKTRIFGRTW